MSWTRETIEDIVTLRSVYSRMRDWAAYNFVPIPPQMNLVARNGVLPEWVEFFKAAQEWEAALGALADEDIQAKPGDWMPHKVRSETLFRILKHRLPGTAKYRSYRSVSLRQRSDL